jgi:hypothetical protein
VDLDAPDEVDNGTRVTLADQSLRQQASTALTRFFGRRRKRVGQDSDDRRVLSSARRNR